MTPYMSGGSAAAAWHQLTIVGSGTSGTAFYVNGAEVASLSNTADSSNIGSIGSNYGTQLLSQQIADPAIYQQSLTAAQVQQLY